MQNRTLRNFITWFIIAGPIWWTCGCYTFREIAGLDELPMSSIEIQTKGNTRYTFREWRYESQGGISGKADRHIPSTSMEFDETVTAFCSLPRDSIARAYFDTKIEVTTRGNSTYYFKEWTWDKMEGIRGQARLEVPFFDQREYKAKVSDVNVTVSIPADSIRCVAAYEFNGNLTFWAVSGFLVLGGVTALAIAVSSSLPH